MLRMVYLLLSFAIVQIGLESEAFAQFGLKIAKLERSFTSAEHTDSYTSIPIVLTPLRFKEREL